MKILKEIKVPTGEIYTAKGDKGVLEFLTVADYGKDANIKADFLGITRELNGVPNGTPMPLTESSSSREAGRLTASSSSVLSEKTIYGGLPSSRAMSSRNARSLANNSSSPSPGTYDPIV